MHQIFRLLLLPVSLISFILGFFADSPIYIWVVSFVLVLIYFIQYSGRKQRIRYWIQGYKIYLKKHDGNVDKSMAAILDEFCSSKYADTSICNKQYLDISDLVQNIISKEFHFNSVLSLNSESPEQVQNEMVKLQKLLRKSKKEIQSIKNKILG